MIHGCTCFRAHWCDLHMKVSIIFGVLQRLEEQRKEREAEKLLKWIEVTDFSGDTFRLVVGGIA